MRNWRVARRLNAILLIPVLLALVLGGFQLRGWLTDRRDADAAKRTAVLVRAALTYGSDLSNERDTSVVPLLSGDTGDARVTAARAATDRARAAFDQAVRAMPRTAGLERRIALVRAGEAQLGALRAAAFTRKLPGVQTEEGYAAVQRPLLELAGELGSGSDAQAAYGRALYAVSLAEEASSMTRSIGTHILVEDTSKLADNEREGQLAAFASYSYLQQVEVEEFMGGATPADRRLLGEQLLAADRKGKQQARAAAAQAQAAGTSYTAPPDPPTMVSAIASGASAHSLAGQGVTPQSWTTASSLSFDAYRRVAASLADEALADARTASADARREVLVGGGVLGGALIAAILAAMVIARSVGRGVRRLRGAALDAAGKQLPELVDQLSRSDPGRLDAAVKPLPVNSRDEIGDVARAFDQVHREAARLASEQAVLRGGVNAVFANLALRNQGLIERQLTLITDLENNEADPDQLEKLFRLDHLATRMRRNGDNLLVLAGKDAVREWNQPAALVDVLRAAASEVEAYGRIELVAIPEAEIHGVAVTDLVHLLAELLENATTFSSPQTKVRVTATWLPDGRVMIEIHDQGIGLTAEDFAQINHKLAEPPTVDAAVSRHMGLFVVGRLSGRHGIRVQLRPSGEQAGTTSLVMLPEPITQGGGGEADGPGGEGLPAVAAVPAVPAVPERPGPAAGTAGPAVEVSRYEQARRPEDAPAADPVGRSPAGGERRQEAPAPDTGTRPGPEELSPAPAAYQDPLGYPAYDADPAGAYQATGYGADGLDPDGYRTGAFAAGPADAGGFAPGSPDAGAFGTGSFDTESFDTGSFQTGSFQTGSFQTGSFGTGSFGTGSFGTGGYQAAAYPTRREPQPYRQPPAGPYPGADYAGPDYQGADLQDPDLQDPDLQDPAYQDPDLQDPAYQDPDHQDPAYQDRPYQDRGARQDDGHPGDGSPGAFPRDGWSAARTGAPRPAHTASRDFGGTAADKPAAETAREARTPGAAAGQAAETPATTLREDEGPRPAEPLPGAPWASEAPAATSASPAERWDAAGPYDLHTQQAESAAAPSAEARERVGFDRLGPAPSMSHSLTDAGLPRRERGGWQQPERQGFPAQSPAEAQPQKRDDAPAWPSREEPEWRSANDENWARAAERIREPKAGGVTPAGLPRRVPQANLVPGAAQQTPQGGPQVSRAPEDVRGRLSNLRRGVQRGRKAGTDTNGQGFGPNHQER